MHIINNKKSRKKSYDLFLGKHVQIRKIELGETGQVMLEISDGYWSTNCILSDIYLRNIRKQTIRFDKNEHLTFKENNLVSKFYQP